jgi:hypothetical protein
MVLDEKSTKSFVRIDHFHVKCFYNYEWWWWKYYILVAYQSMMRYSCMKWLLQLISHLDLIHLRFVIRWRNKMLPMHSVTAFNQFDIEYIHQCLCIWIIFDSECFRFSDTWLVYSLKKWSMKLLASDDYYIWVREFC